LPKLGGRSPAKGRRTIQIPPRLAESNVARNRHRIEPQRETSIVTDKTSTNRFLMFR
jgi:hypothetical protein